MVFVDDVLIYSLDVETHALHLRTVLETLRQHQLYAKFSKCEFWLSESMFLSHIIFGEGIKVDLAMVEVVSSWERLKTVSEIRSFLDLAGYYRWFISDFSLIVAPMTGLTRKGVLLMWNQNYEESFNVLNARLISAPMLTLPFGSGGLIVYSDSCGSRLVCVLMQHGNVVAYASRQLKNHERNYQNHERNYRLMILRWLLWYLH